MSTIFTLEEARALLPQVRDITQRHHDLVEALHDEGYDHQDQERRFEQRANAVVQDWISAIQALGVEVKGLWLADFDSGDGYYWCWKLGEADIEHFHHYDAGFAGRRPISLLE